MSDSQTKLAYKASYSSFAGSDIVAAITIPDFSAKPIVVGELQTISYSIHREVSPVRTLGRINPIGFTAGARTIAGSLIFTVFNKNLVYEIKKLIHDSLNPVEATTQSKTLKSKLGFREADIMSDYAVMDEMPPFDVTITFQNEYGNRAGIVIKGIVIVDEGQVMSIEDMITENTMSYFAHDIQPLKDLGSVRQAKSPAGGQTVKDAFGSPSKDITLNNLLPSRGRLIPSFDKNIYNYTIEIPDTLGDIPQLQAIASDPLYQVSVQHPTDLSGMTYVRVSYQGQTTTYTVKYKQVSANPRLSAIYVSGEPLPDFNPSLSAYTLTLPYGTKSAPRVTATAEDPRANVSVQRTFPAPGSAVLTVTAHDGVTKNTYTVSFTQDTPDSNSYLSLIATSDGRIDPQFNHEFFDYNIVLPYGAVGVPHISASAQDASSRVSIQQATSVPGVAKIICTAQDMSKTTYVCNIKPDIKPFSKSLDMAVNSSVTFKCCITDTEGSDAVGRDTILSTGGEPVYLETTGGIKFTPSSTQVSITGTYLGFSHVLVKGQTIPMRKVRVTAIS